MHVPVDPIGDEAPPPPYAAYDADPAVTPNYESLEPANPGALSVRTSLRGGYTRHIPSQEPENVHSLSPAAYFEERQFQRNDAFRELDTLEHNIHFDSGTTPTRLPFPRPSDAYLSRELTGQDWATFVNFLFPLDQEDRKTKKKSHDKRRRFDGLHSPERREKIQAVVAEWNVGFFAPRFIRITAHFEPLSHSGAPSSALPQASRYGDEKSRGFSTDQDPVNRGPQVPAYDYSSAPPANPSHDGPPNVENSKTLRRSGSKSSISSSSSSSSESSVDSIASKDFKHATLPEIQAIIATFRDDPHKKNHLRKSVKDLRGQLRSQHLPMTSSDPYSTKFSKDEKKKFKDQRKILKKEIKSIIKEAKGERKAGKNFRRAARRDRRDARKQVRQEVKQARQQEKHCHRERKIANRGAEHPRPPLTTSAIPGISQAHAAYARGSSWSNDRVAAVRTHSNDAALAARQKAELARQNTIDVAAAAGGSARQASLQARDSALLAGRRASNSALNVATKAHDTAAAAAATYGTSRSVMGPAERILDMARRPFDAEERRRRAAAQQRADAAAVVLATGNLAIDDEEDGAKRDGHREREVRQRSEDFPVNGQQRDLGAVAELRTQITGQADPRAPQELRTQITGQADPGAPREML